MRTGPMKLTICLAVLLGSLSSLKAQTPIPTPLKKINPPLFLKPTDKTPSKGLVSPEVPELGPDRSPLKVEMSIEAPPANIMGEFSDPEFYGSLKALKKSENDIGVVNWHLNNEVDFDYCHLRDEQGNHWFGWTSGDKFHWILMTGNHYWWHDEFAGHWLYFGKGHWWRADGKKVPGQLQVLVDGEYYLCQRDGQLLKDMGQDGNGQILSGNGPFRGDFHHGGHGHGGGQSAYGNRGNSFGQ